MPYLLDTHTLVWYARDDRRLSNKVRKLLIQSSEEFLVSNMSLAEATMVMPKENVKEEFENLVHVIDADNRFRILPLDREVVQASLEIRSIAELHDRLIMATALVVASRGQLCSLITRDELITASKIVPVIW